jgi:hypothetical protein
MIGSGIGKKIADTAKRLGLRQERFRACGDRNCFGIFRHASLLWDIDKTLHVHAPCDLAIQLTTRTLHGTFKGRQAAEFR